LTSKSFLGWDNVFCQGKIRRPHVPVTSALVKVRLLVQPTQLSLRSWADDDVYLVLGLPLQLHHPRPRKQKPPEGFSAADGASVHIRFAV